MISTTTQTMSSLEIATLTGKRHDNVLKDIRYILDQAGIDPTKFLGVYKDQQLIERPCFNLPRRECDLVVSGYSVLYRLAIIDRWQALESEKSIPKPETANVLPEYHIHINLAIQPETTAIIEKLKSPINYAPAPFKRGPYSEAELSTIIELRAAGGTYDSISRALNRSLDSLKGAIVKLKRLDRL